ncbi:MAG TPA: hypothetical protein VK939_17015, partial [Longimicrobiales bacterium]|nr:hypothetical protein [Longimicrobiales bacterium]
LPTAVVPPPLLGTDDEFTELMIPVGLGAGMTLPTGPLNTTLYAVPQFIWLRTSYTTPETSEDATETAFGARAGVTLSRGSFFGGGSVFTTTLDEFDPRFVFQLGFLLGGRDD